MRVQVPPRAQTKQRISPGQSTFYGVTVRGLSPDLSHEAATPESAGRGSRSPAQHMSTRSTAKVFPQRTCADVDCGVVFQATTDAHRYCSRRCLLRSDAEREHRRRYQLKHGREPRPKRAWWRLTPLP